MALSLPNTITAGSTADAVELESNFQAIKTFVDALQQTQISDDAAQTVAVTAVDGRVDTLETETDANTSGLAAHIADTSDAHDASAISCVATGSISSTNVQAAIGELENEIDAVQSDVAAIAQGSWSNLSLTSGWSDYAGRQDAEYRKVGDEVQLRGVIDGGTTTSGTTIATLPSGFRPPAEDLFPIAGSGDIGGGYILVKSNGVMEVWGISANGALGLSGVRFSTS